MVGKTVIQNGNSRNSSQKFQKKKSQVKVCAKYKKIKFKFTYSYFSKFCAKC